MYTKVIQSGAITEIYKYQKIPSMYGKKSSRPSKATKRANRTAQQITTRRFDNLRATRKKFLRTIWSNLNPNSKPLFLTLTTSKITSTKTSSRFLHDFIRSLRLKTKINFRYIAVPEYQKRGAIHYHLLVWDLPSVYAKTERTTRNIQRTWGRGFIDCVATDGDAKIAGYLAKYMSKTLSDIRNAKGKTYYTSRNLMRAVQYASPTLDQYLDLIVPVDNCSLQEMKFDTHWLGSCTYQRIINNVYGEQERCNDIRQIHRSEVG